MIAELKHIALVMAVALLAVSCQNKEDADLIIRNAKIYTVNNSFAVMQSAVVKNGKFVAISNDANIMARYTSDSILELKGKFVYPGFIDAHAHFVQYAISLSQIDLADADSLNAVIRLLTDYQQKNPGKWIVARNLKSSFIDDGEMTDNELFNKLFAKTPVFVWTAGYKSAIVNKAFIQKSKLNVDSPNGIISGVEAQMASRCIPAPADSEMELLLRQAEQDCFNVGITSTTDFGAQSKFIKLIDKMQGDGTLKIPVYAILEPSAENIEAYISKIPYYTENLKVLAVGFDIDGRLLQHSAVMLEPYGSDGINGTLNISADSLMNICQQAYDHGFQVCLGCVGDSAVRLAINTYAKILPHKNDMRWRIENLHMISHKDLRKLGHFNIMPSVQPMQFKVNSNFIKENFDRRHIKESFAWKQLLDQNQGIVCGTNAPFGKLNPMAVYYSAIRQEKRKANNKQSQEMTPTQALKAMTIWPAYSQFDEKSKGSLEVGKWADFIVTSENITTMYQPNIPDLTVDMTYLHGKRVK